MTQHPARQHDRMLGRAAQCIDDVEAGGHDGERIGIAAYYSRTDYGQGHDFAQAAGGQLRVGF